MYAAIAAPTIDPSTSGCSPSQVRKLRDAYVQAGFLARGALVYLRALENMCLKGREQAWEAGPARAYFGRWSGDKLQLVVRAFSRLGVRFEEGFRDTTSISAPRFECFPQDHSRCHRGLLANASIYGTVRVCPSLLKRPDGEVSAVILHEMLHQGLGIADQKHHACGSRKDHRCYRGGALRLVENGRVDLASRNTDNYVGFACAVARALARSRGRP